MLTKRDVIELGRALGAAAPTADTKIPDSERWGNLVQKVRHALIPTNRYELFDRLIINPKAPL